MCAHARLNGMARGRSGGHAPRRPARPAGKRPVGKKPVGKKPTGASAPKPAPKKKPAPSPSPAPPPAGPFRLGAVEGATPGKWIRIWEERMPRNPLDLVPVPFADQRAALAGVDAALVRLPIDSDGLHLIALYDEVPVVVVSVDSELTAADELEVSDLDGEVLITPADDVLHVTVPGTVEPVFDAPETTEDAVATVAAGVGVLVVPMSLARLHHRKDVTYRPLRGGPVSTVAFAWDADRTTELVDAFVGIVRGRTANSSR